MLELVFAPAADWIGRSDEDIMAATMKVRILSGMPCGIAVLDSDVVRDTRESRRIWGISRFPMQL